MIILRMPQGYPTVSRRSDINAVGLSHLRVWAGLGSDERRMERPSDEMSVTVEYIIPALRLLAIALESNN
jgi:hypothetical protein